jgi:hypothetical protein
MNARKEELLLILNSLNKGVRVWVWVWAWVWVWVGVDMSSLSLLHPTHTLKKR